MGGVYICPTHGKQGLTGASQRLYEGLHSGAGIPADWVSMVVVIRESGGYPYLVDSQKLIDAGLDPACSPLLLRDRNRKQRELNDRLLIQRLTKCGASRLGACRHCLAEAIRPQGTARLEFPTELEESL